jgi:hypothetical protein
LLCQSAEGFSVLGDTSGYLLLRGVTIWDHWVMDYFAFPETINVRSDECRGSMTVQYTPQLIQLHAVGRNDDGTMRTQTECGRPAYFPTEEVEHQPWENVNPTLRCLRCGVASGFLAVNDNTGEFVPGR